MNTSKTTQATAGQGANDDGGYWYVMRPSGQIAGN